MKDGELNIDDACLIIPNWWCQVNKIIDDGEYLTQKYVTHDKKPMRVIISVKKDTVFDDKSKSTNHGKQDIKSGA